MSEQLEERMAELDMGISTWLGVGYTLLVRVHAARKSYCILDSKSIGTDKRS